MDEHLTISTPEQVAFHYEVAGIGSRFVASLLDHLIIIIALFLIYCAAASIGPAIVLGGEAGETAAYWVLAFLVLVSFLIIWGYFVLFEMLWNGQTPGKRSLRLRVIRRNGQPIGGGEAVTRNLVRIIDLLPGFYGIGLISMFIDKEARRLGDFAAGTIVIREGEQTSLRDVRVPASQVPSSLNSPEAKNLRVASEAGPLNPQSSHQQSGYPSPRPDPLAGISLRELTPDDYRLIRETLARVRRGELDYRRGEELATRLADGVASRLGHDFREWQARGWTPLSFLESILAAQEARG